MAARLGVKRLREAASKFSKEDSLHFRVTIRLHQRPYQIGTCL